MKYHLNIRGKRTTITIDDALCDYLLQKIGGFYALLGGEEGRKKVRKWIQKTVEREQTSIPEKNISQWVQARVLNEIVDPALLEKHAKSVKEMDSLKKTYQATQKLPTLPLSAR